MKKKYFVADLDGTLLHRAQAYLHPNEEEKNAICELINNNHEFVVASGRMKNDIDTLLTNMDVKSRFVIAQNGAMVYENDEVISCRTLSFQIVEKIVLLLKEWGYKPEYVSISTNTNTTYMKLYSWKGLLLKLRYKQRVSETKHIQTWRKDTIKQLQEKNVEITRLLIAYHSTEKLRKIKEKLHEHFGESIEQYFSGKYSLEICSEDVSKATAIEMIMEKAEIDQESITFIGDSGNDVSVFEFLPHTYVMSHAAEEYKLPSSIEVPRVAHAITDFLEGNVKDEAE